RPRRGGALGRGTGYRVVQGHLAGAAVEPDEDDRGVARRPARLGLGLEDLRQAESGHAGDAEFEEGTPTQAIAITAGAAQIEIEHCSTPPERKCLPDLSPWAQSFSMRESLYLPPGEKGIGKAISRQRTGTTSCAKPPSELCCASVGATRRIDLSAAGQGAGGSIHGR